VLKNVQLFGSPVFYKSSLHDMLLTSFGLVAPSVWHAYRRHPPGAGVRVVSSIDQAEIRTVRHSSWRTLVYCQHLPSIHPSDHSRTCLVGRCAYRQLAVKHWQRKRRSLAGFSSFVSLELSPDCTGRSSSDRQLSGIF